MVLVSCDTSVNVFNVNDCYYTFMMNIKAVSYTHLTLPTKRIV